MKSLLGRCFVNAIAISNFSCFVGHNVSSDPRALRDSHKRSIGMGGKLKMDQDPSPLLFEYRPGFTDVRRPFLDAFGCFPSLTAPAMIYLSKGCQFENELHDRISRAIHLAASRTNNHRS